VNFPPDALLSESNFVLNRDGTAGRRLGMDLEADYSLKLTNTLSATRENYATNTFTWKGAGGDDQKDFLAVQVGRDLYFYDTGTATAVSASLVFTFEMQNDILEEVDFDSVDGKLLIATGEKEIEEYSWDGTDITRRMLSLLIRDQFGVEDIDTTTQKDLGLAPDISFRPTTLSDHHLYNLRNQTFGPAIANYLRDSWDAIQEFFDFSNYARYPSNADNVAEGLEVNPDFDPPAEAFTAQGLQDRDPFNVEAPKGYFIIDAMERGNSRELAFLTNHSNTSGRTAVNGSNRDLTVTFAAGNPLPTDKTPGGPSVVANYAGRAVFMGFSGEVEDGDSRSPRMSSFVLYSQLVKNSEDFVKCYQDGDPTSRDTPDLVATDGGFIKINDAYGIKAAVPLNDKLFIFAENGVWMLEGEADEGFSAQNFRVKQISKIGTKAKKSVVEADGSVYYWSEDGIYRVVRSEVGQYGVENITESTIKRLFTSIPSARRRKVKSTFDEFERKVRWLFGDISIGATDSGRELVFDVVSGGFSTTHTYKSVGRAYPVLLDYIKVDSFPVGQVAEDVTDTSGATVTDSLLVDITVSLSTRSSSLRNTKYLTYVGEDTSKENMSFSEFTNSEFKDWSSIYAPGVDAEAHLTMGYFNGGELARVKQAPVVSFFFERTETGVAQGADDIELVTPSGCLAQFRWDWADSSSSNRWSTARQVYRLGRYTIPATASEAYDYGFSVVTTRNKMRGKGKVFSTHLATETGKDCKVLGWSVDIQMNQEV
jgi:hypothetical protein